MFWLQNRLIGRGAGGTGLTLAFQASAVSNAATITVPASVVDDDFGVLFDMAIGASTPSAVTPTNWTNRHSSGGSVGGQPFRRMVSTKILTTAEASGSITGMNDTAEDKVMLVFRPSRAIVTQNFSTFNGETTAGSPSLQTVSAAGNASPLLVLASAGITTGGTAAFSTASPAFTATVDTGDADLRVGYIIYNSSPVNHSIDMDDLGVVNQLISFFVSFA
jgi:hypothetical protein